jgi:hypothetical protein
MSRTEGGQGSAKEPGVVERLTRALREAEDAHRRHEQEESGCPHEDWSRCYAEHLHQNSEAEGYALTLLPPH